MRNIELNKPEHWGLIQKRAFQKSLNAIESHKNDPRLQAYYTETVAACFAEEDAALKCQEASGANGVGVDFGSSRFWPEAENANMFAVFSCVCRLWPRVYPRFAIPCVSVRGNGRNSSP